MRKDEQIDRNDMQQGGSLDKKLQGIERRKETVMTIQRTGGVEVRQIAMRTKKEKDREMGRE